MTPARFVAKSEGVERAHGKALPIGTPLHGGNRVSQRAALKHLAPKPVPDLVERGGQRREAKSEENRREIGTAAAHRPITDVHRHFTTRRPAEFFTRRSNSTEREMENITRLHYMIGE